MSKKSSTRPLRSCARLVWPLIQTPQVLDRFADAGCEITSDNAVRFKRELVEGCLETGERRDSTWEDLATITRVADALHRSARHLEIACLSSKPIRSDKLRFLLLATGNYAAFCQAYRW